MNGTVQNYLMWSHTEKYIKKVWLIWNYLKRPPENIGIAKFNLYDK